MILVPFFEIPHGDRLAKNVLKLCVQVIPRSTTYPRYLFFLCLLQLSHQHQIKAVMQASLSCITTFDIRILLSSALWEKKLLWNQKFWYWWDKSSLKKTSLILGTNPRLSNFCIAQRCPRVSKNILYHRRHKNTFSVAYKTFLRF